ncbi:MAG: hypothetical protein ACRD2E_11810 [Terriglobales bacterium]
MKTTVEISDTLLRQAKRLAAAEKMTLRELIEQGLRREIEDRPSRRPFKLRPVVFRGQGMTPEFEGASWERIRAAIYEGHGG